MIYLPSTLLSKINRTNENNRTEIINLLLLVTIIVVIAFSEKRNLVIGSLGIFVFFYIFQIIKNKQVKISIYFIWMGLFIFWSLIVTLFSYDIVNSTEQTLNLILKFIFYTSLIMFFDSKEKIFLGIKALIIASLILVIRLLIVTPTELWGTERLGIAINLNSNSIGMIASYASLSSIYLAKKFGKKYYYIFIIPFSLITLFSGSRKGFLIFAIGIILLLLFYSNNIRRFLTTALSISIFFVFIYKVVFDLPTLYNVIGKRLESLLNFIMGNTHLIDASMRTRKAMIDEAIMLIKEKPIMGYGHENFRLLSMFDTYSHNNYTEILVSTGIIGLCIYYSLPMFILVLSIIKRIKLKDNEYNLIIIYLLIILIMDIGIVSYSHILTQLLIVISVSYYTILMKKEEKKSIINTNNVCNRV